MKTKTDFSKIAMNAVGQLSGLAVTTQINRIPFVKNIQKPAIKGAAMFAIGSLLVPMIADKAGLNKKGSSAVIDGVSQAISVYGLAVLGNSFAPNIFPAVSGYEDGVYNVQGMGLITDEDDVSGYEDDPINGTDDDDTVGDLDEE